MYMYMNITFLHIHMFTCVFVSSDKNECTDGTAKCIQTCINTPGSFHCECNTGFVLNSDGATCDGEYYRKHTCTCVHTKKYNMYMYVQNHTYISNHLDIDECSEGTDDCSHATQTCMNTIGSFTCVHVYNSGFDQLLRRVFLKPYLLLEYITTS